MGIAVSGPGVRVLGIRLRGEGFGVQVSGWGFRVLKRDKVRIVRPQQSTRLNIPELITIPKLTCWVCGTKPSTLVRKRARAHQTGGPKETETELETLAVSSSLLLH